MATPLGAMKVELGLEASDFNASLTGAKRAVTFFQTAAKSLDAVLKNNANNVGLLSTKYKTLKQAMEAQKNVINNMGQKLSTLKEGTAEWEKQAIAIDRETAKLEGLKTQLDQVTAAMKQAISQSGFTGWLQSSGEKLQTFGQKAEAAGAHFRAMSTTLGGGMVYAAKTAIDFESAMAGVYKTVDGTPAQLEAVKNGIRDMALEIPATTTEIAGVAEAAGQLGIATDDVLDFTRVMMELGTSTNLSAAEAATALAQFTNITGMSKDKIRNLGDTIVALGNNSATTEKDIVNLATRIAGAGNQVGLTEAEIMGLSAAMASVGLSAEAGGTAMSTIMTKINKAVASGGESLQNFASIAGVSAEEFSSKWKSSPTEALELFTKGLGKALEEGKNIDQMLADLGVTGIRETDTIKRLASAGELMGDSFKLANESFNESGALANEAAQRYETVESKLQILKNKLTDIAIDLGEPVIEALSSAIDAAEPLLKTISDLAKGFTKLPKRTQTAIIGLVGFGAALSPVLSTVGKFSTWLGTGTSALGKFLGAIKANGAITNMTASLGSASGAVGTLTTKSSMLAGILGNGGLLFGGMVAITALAATVAAAHGEAAERTGKWGDVSQETAGKLSDFRDKVNDANVALATFGDGSNGKLEETKQAVDNIKESITSLADEALQNRLSELKDTISDPDVYKRAAKNATEYYEGLKRDAENAAKAINKIYENASKNNREISATEKQMIKEMTQGMIQTEIELLEDGAKAKTELLKLANGDMVRLSEEQYRDVMSQTEKFIAEENEAYQNRRENLKKDYRDGILSKADYNAEMNRLDAEHTATIDHWTDIQKRALASQLKEAKKNTGEQGEMWDNFLTTFKAKLKEYGFTMEEIEAMLNKTGDSTSKMAAKLKEGVAESEEAINKWNSMVLDEKTGDFKTNIKEAVKEAIQSEEGWNNLKFVVKNADLTSNAKIEVARAIQEAGRWDELTPEEKQLLIDGSEAIATISQSEELYNTWNSLPEEVKNLLADNSIFMNEAGVAKEFLEGWNNLSAEDKELYAKDLTEGDVTSAQNAINGVRQGEPAKVEAKDETSEGTTSAKSNLESVANGEYKAEVTAEDRTEPTKQSIWQKFTSLFQSDDTKVKITGKDDTQPAIAQAKAGIASLKQDAPVDLKANNQTQAGVNSAQSTVDSLKQKSPASLKAKNNAKPGVSSAQSTVNSLKGKTVDAKAKAVGKGAVDNLKSSIDSLYNKTVTVTTIVREVKQKAKGDNNFEGGLAMVNDQKGSLYKELITLPSGRSFIPEGRDVVMPLPKGTKILRASKTKQLMNNMGIPRFADGLGIPSDAKFMRDIERATVLPSKYRRDSYLDTDRIVDGLTELETKVVRVLKALLNKDSTIVLDGAVLSEKITKRQTKSTRLANRMNGVVT